VKLERLTLAGLNTEREEPFDITVLAGKPKLTTLILDDVQVQDLSFLKDSPDLSYLKLGQVPVLDLSPLAENAALKSLELSKVPVKDLEPIRDLSKLKTLILHYTEVTDLTPVTAFKDQLTRLNLSGAKATDMGPVGELSVLRDIFLDETQFDDYSPLAKCSELKSLQARNDKSGFNTLEVIKSMPNLETLRLDRNDNVQDWSALKTATSIKNLSVGETSFSDLSLLEGFVKLEALNIRKCTVIHPEVIVKLPKLKRITIYETQGIDDITMFKDLPSIKDLDLNYRSKQFPQEQIDALEEAKKSAGK
jgi:internalin A